MARGVEEVSTSSSETTQVTHQFVNSTNQPVHVVWVDFQGSEQSYQCLQPGHSSAQRSSAVVEALGVGHVSVRPLNPDFQPDPAWGAWRTRAEACGIPVMAYECVGEAAVAAACTLLRHMLAGCPPEVMRRMTEAKACVGIIGRCQVTSDMPGHTHLKLSQGGRDLDATARGLGGCEGCPLTTCGEENLTMVDDTRYPSENILLHEFAHTVMNLGMTEGQRQAVRRLHENALKLGLYSQGCYALENADEYWAEGSQAWFEATVREDVNGGINTRDKLAAHDPGLAAIMQQIWGQNEWRYQDNAPSQFRTSHTPPNQGSTASHIHPTTTTSTSNGPADPPAVLHHAHKAPGTMAMARTCAVRLGHAAAVSCGGCLPAACLPSGAKRRRPGLQGSVLDEGRSEFPGLPHAARPQDHRKLRGPVAEAQGAPGFLTVLEGCLPRRLMPSLATSPVSKNL